MIHVHSMQTCMHGYRPDVCVSMVLRLHPNFLQSLLVSELFFVVYKIFMSQRRGIHVNNKLLTQDIYDPPKIITTTDRLAQDQKQWVVQTHDCTTSCMYDHLALWLTMGFSLWSINHVCTFVSDFWLVCWMAEKFTQSSSTIVRLSIVSPTYPCWKISILTAPS